MPVEKSRADRPRWGPGAGPTFLRQLLKLSPAVLFEGQDGLPPTI
jgi:hypothetical protein